MKKRRQEAGAAKGIRVFVLFFVGAQHAAPAAPKLARCKRRHGPPAASRLPQNKNAATLSRGALFYINKYSRFYNFVKQNLREKLATFVCNQIRACVTVSPFSAFFRNRLLFRNGTVGGRRC